jgi:hypothetical protein
MLQITEQQVAAGLGSRWRAHQRGDPAAKRPAQKTGWATYCANSLGGCRSHILIWIMVLQRRCPSGFIDPCLPKPRLQEVSEVADVMIR